MLSSTLKTLSLTAEIQIQKIPDTISSKNAKQIKDFRTTLFQIEALLRLLRKSSFFEPPQINQLQHTLKKIKSLEDLLGEWDFSIEILVNHKTKLSKIRQKELTKTIQLQSKKIITEINKPIWQSPLKDNLLANVNFLFQIEPNKSQKLILKNLKKIIKRTQEKIKKELLPEFTAKKYSHLTMETYFHDFRRSIRWIAITIQIFPELFSLSHQPQKLSTKNKSLVKNYCKNPLANLPFKNCLVKINLLSYYQLSEFIFIAGELKDAAAIYFLLSKETKNPNPQKELMIKTMREYLDINLPTHLLLEPGV